MHVYFTSVGTIHLLSWETEVIWSKHTDPVIVFPVIDKEGSITSVSPLGEDQLVQSNWRFRVPQAPPNRLFCSPVWWVLSRPPVQTKLWWEKELFHHKHITTFCTRVRRLMEPESTTVKSVSIDRSQFCCLVKCVMFGLDYEKSLSQGWQTNFEWYGDGEKDVGQLTWY